MVIGILLSPIFKSSAPVSPEAKPTKAQCRENLKDWCDLSFERDWSAAILAYLRERSRETIPLWRMVNAVSAESLPRNRPEERARRKEILAALSGLIKEKRVFRWRRKNVAILDPGKEIIPF